MNLRQAEKVALVRLVGTTSRPHSAGKSDIVQQEGAGQCPCSARAAHAVIPATYALREYHSLRARGLSLRKRFRSRGPRRLAALHYAKSSVDLSKTWDRVAASLFMPHPGTLLRSPPAVADLHMRVLAVNPASPFRRRIVRLGSRVSVARKLPPPHAHRASRVYVANPVTPAPSPQRRIAQPGSRFTSGPAVPRRIPDG